jgi:hypothetical protein
MTDQLIVTSTVPCPVTGDDPCSRPYCQHEDGRCFLLLRQSAAARRFPRREHHAERNARIRAEYERCGGATGLLPVLAKEYELTPARIHQIVRGRVRT